MQNLHIKPEELLDKEPIFAEGKKQRRFNNSSGRQILTFESGLLVNHQQFGYVGLGAFLVGAEDHVDTGADPVA